MVSKRPQFVPKPDWNVASVGVPYWRSPRSRTSDGAKVEARLAVDSMRHFVAVPWKFGSFAAHEMSPAATTVTGPAHGTGPSGPQTRVAWAEAAMAPPVQARGVVETARTGAPQAAPTSTEATSTHHPAARAADLGDRTGRPYEPSAFTSLGHRAQPGRSGGDCSQQALDEVAGAALEIVATDLEPAEHLGTPALDDVRELVERLARVDGVGDEHQCSLAGQGR